MRRPSWVAKALLAIGVAALSVLPARAQIGPILPAPGPVNRSMGGTAVAAPIDGLGALYWNPATITHVPNTMDFGLEIFFPHSSLASSVPANAFGPGLPPVPLAGEAISRPGIFPLPSVSLVYHAEDWPLTFGLGAFPVAGFGANYPGSLLNPIVSPQRPNGLGLGPIYSQFSTLQIAPAVAWKINDHLSVAAGPTIDLSSLDADPLFVVSPNPDGSYPPGTHSRIAWGAGFQMGVYYRFDNGFRVGASFKSPQWLETFQWQTVDNLGRPRLASWHFDLPMIPSVGVAYHVDRWLIGSDLRYVDFGNAAGLSQSGFDPSGAVRGLGWKSCFGLTFGVQYLLTDSLSLRAGYTYNGSPIEDQFTSFNVASTTIIEHTVSLGASYKLTDLLTLSLAYAHGFENSNTGPLVTPLGAIPGSMVRNKASVDTIIFGARVRFGPHVNTPVSQ
jgi:long-chain fatty acid transport protein